MSAKILTDVANRIADIQRKQLTDTDRLFLATEISKESVTAKFKSVNYDTMINILAKSAIEHFSSIKYDKQIDLRQHFNEILAETDNIPYRASVTSYSNVSVTDLLGLSIPFDLQQIFNPEASYTRNYIVLYSEYRNKGFSSPYKYQWNYTDTQNMMPGTTASIGGIRDIVAIRLIKPYLPQLFPIFGTVPNYSERVSFLIEEFATQAFTAGDQRKFHFMLGTQTSFVSDDTTIEDFSDGIFWVRKPLTNINTLTISIANPLIPYNLDNFGEFKLQFEFIYKSPVNIQ